MYYWHNSGTLYVDQQKGDDRSSGYAMEHDGYGNGPLRSLDRALEKIGQMRCVGKLRPVTVMLLEDYYLERPLVFSEQLHSVTVQSLNGRQKLVGGFRLTGWRRDEYNGVPCLSARLPQRKDGAPWDFSDLVVNGKYARLTRYPRVGTLRAVRTEKDAGDGESQPLSNPTKWFQARGEDLAAVPDFARATVNFYHYWVDAHSPVEHYDPETGIVTLRYPSRFSINTRYGSDDGAVPMHQAAFRYFLTNVPSQFGAPGEWFLDAPSGTVYYIPDREGAEPEEMEAFVPTVSRLVEVRSRNVRIQGLEILCGRGEYVSATERDGVRTEYASDIQSLCGATGAIVFEGAVRCGIESCHIHSMGVHALEIRPGCRYIRIENNNIEDICGGGISIWGGAAAEEAPVETSGILIRRNRISRCGIRYAAGNGVLVRHASDVEISDNEICYLDYSGITAGWVWGYAPSTTSGIVIRGNHIHHIGRGLLADMGGIYLLGNHQGTVVAENRIHDVCATVYGGWGIYTDEGCSYALIENNVVFNTWSESYHHNYGCGNLVRNNIFAFGATGCVNASRDETHEGFLLESNILITDGVPFYASTIRLQPVRGSKNLYWDVSRPDPVFLGRNGGRSFTYSDRLPRVWGTCYGFRDWTEKMHMDPGSILADPGFVDVENRDFRLREDSPAFGLGFRAINGFPAIERKAE